MLTNGWCLCLMSSKETKYEAVVSTKSLDFGTPVHDERHGLPAFGVSTRRFKGRGMLSGRQGTPDHVLRLQRRLRRLCEEQWNMWLRTRRRIEDSSGVFSRR
jgi:hypothetical protein